MISPAMMAIMHAKEGRYSKYNKKPARTGSRRHKTKETTLLIPNRQHSPARLPRDNMGSYPLAGPPAEFLKLYDSKLEIELSTPSLNTRAKRRRVAKAEAATVGIRRRSSQWFHMRQIEKQMLETGASEFPEKMKVEDQKFRKRKARNPITYRLNKVGDEPKYDA